MICVDSKCKAGYGPAVYAFSLIYAKCGLSAASGWMRVISFLRSVPYHGVLYLCYIQATAPPFSAFYFDVPDILYDGVNLLL